jgi:cell division control protein 45
MEYLYNNGYSVMESKNINQLISGNARNARQNLHIQKSGAPLVCLPPPLLLALHSIPFPSPTTLLYKQATNTSNSTMILEIEDWHLGYDQIVKDTRGSDVGSVWVLCNADVDSLAAARILTYMFRADSIPYQLRPCWSYSTLTSLLQNEDSQDIRALVLLNLGASRNLTKLFDVDMLLGNAKVYVMDCRKPVHLANVHAGHNVVVFWDETQNRNELPSDGDNLSGNDDTTDEDDDSSSSDDDDDSDDDEDPDEGEAEFYDDDDKSKKKKETKIRSASDDEQDREYDGEDEDGAEDDDDDEPKKRTAGQDDDEKSATKRRKTGDDEGSATTAEEVATPEKKVTTTLTPKELHQQRRNRLRGYYSGGSFYGSPVAWVAYRLASQKRWHDNGDLLWLACIGLTDAYLHARIDMAGYTSLSVDLKTSCQRVFPNDMVDRVEKTIYAESLMGNEGGSQTQITLSDNGRILAETDYRFFLLRHSSLYDSMIYSNYVANRLQVWSTQGKQRLQELLAKMGFPLDECKQPFAFMNPHLKRKLNSKMKEYAGVSDYLTCM